MTILTRFINTGLPSSLAYVVRWVEKMECNFQKKALGMNMFNMSPAL